jgi:hypothetical protein
VAGDRLAPAVAMAAVELGFRGVVALGGFIASVVRGGRRTAARRADHRGHGLTLVGHVAPSPQGHT